MRSRSVRTLAVLLALSILPLSSACTTVSPAAIKDKRSSGVTRRYDRPAPDLYEASVLAMGRIRADHPYYSGLEVVEQDAATGTVIAEQRLDSAVIPGLGEKDAIGIFVAEAPGGESDVTVVALASDQIPGQAGTYVASLNGAEARVFPAIESALAAMPERTAARSAAPSVPPASLGAAAQGSAAPAAPNEPAPSTIAGAAVAETRPPAAAIPETATEPRVARLSPPPSPSAIARVPSSELIDRAYGTLRAGGRWRPLVRETRADGSEELRIGGWATLTEAGGRLRVVFADRSVSAADAAQLALELDAAGLPVEVAPETGSTSGR